MMWKMRLLGAAVGVLGLFLNQAGAGGESCCCSCCQSTPSAKDKDKKEKEEAEIKAALAKLPEKDRKLAEEQKYCPISDERLGSMGKPRKILVKDQPVFLCCKGCEKKALADPDKTLAKVKELKAKAREEKE
jgi:hypothetical protein